MLHIECGELVSQLTTPKKIFLASQFEGGLSLDWLRFRLCGEVFSTGESKCVVCSCFGGLCSREVYLFVLA